MKKKRKVTEWAIIIGFCILFFVLIINDKLNLTFNIFSVILAILSIFAGSSLLAGSSLMTNKEYKRWAKDSLFGFVKTLLFISLSTLIIAVLANIKALEEINIILFAIIFIIGILFVSFNLIDPIFNLLAILEEELGPRNSENKIVLRKK